MDNDDHERSPQFFIGPGSSDDPGTLLDEARQRVRDEDARNKESHKLARRLLMALLLIVLLSVVFYVVMPYYGLRLSPMVPLLCFISIVAGAVLTYRDSPLE